MSQVLVSELPELGEAGIGVRSRRWWGWRRSTMIRALRSRAHHIRGGRATVRTALFIGHADGAAETRSGGIRQIAARRLKSNGKPKKVALVACMGGLKELCNQPAWDQKPPANQTPAAERNKGKMGQSPGCLSARKSLDIQDSRFPPHSYAWAECDSYRLRLRSGASLSAAESSPLILVAFSGSHRASLLSAINTRSNSLVAARRAGLL